jgi:hypothetical protein
VIEQAEASRAPWLGAFQIFLRGRTDDGKRANVKPIPVELLEPVTADVYHAEPALTLTPEAARELLDSLLAAGIRPSTEIPDASGVVAAKDEHIRDLRRVAFKEGGQA